MKAWVTALRIARREARRAKGRSMLVIAMIGLPVAVIAFLAANYDMFNLTPQERVDRRIGTADALVSWERSGEISQWAEGYLRDGWEAAPAGTKSDADVLAVLPPGSRVLRVAGAETRVRTKHGLNSFTTTVTNAADPLLRGMMNVLEGTPPAAGQVALNEAAADLLSVKVGDALRLENPGRDVVVSAIVDFPEGLYPQLVLPHGAHVKEQSASWLVDAPATLDWAAVQQLNKHGIRVASRPVVLNPPPGTAVPDGQDAERIGMGLFVVGLVIVEIVLLAGPAFAVGAKRRTRELALVAAAGGQPKHLRRIVLADGVVLGAIGAVVGIALGVIAAFATLPLMEQYAAGARAGGYRMFPLAQLGIVALAIGTGMLAALVPAFTAARQNVVQALTGRRGTVRSRKRWLALGVVVIAAGVAVALFGATDGGEELILAGIILAELGLVVITPAVIGLVSRIGGVLPPAQRMALRQTARNRSAAAPAVSAVMAAVAGAVTAGVLVEGMHQQTINGYEQILPMGHVAVRSGDHDLTRVAAAVRDSLPGADVQVYHSANELEPKVPAERRCPYLDMADPTPEDEKRAAGDERCRTMREAQSGLYAGTVVGDGAAIAALTGAEPGEVAKARAALARGSMVVTHPLYLKDGKVQLGELSVDGILLTAPVKGAMAFVPESVARQAGFSSKPMGVVAGTREMPSQAERDRLTAALSEIDPDLGYTLERGPFWRKDPMALLLALGAAAIALIAAAIATGLAAADSRPDLATLAAVGATPRVRRVLSLSQAGVISGLGALLGTVTGLGASAVLVMALNNFYANQLHGPGPVPLLIPWDAVAIVVAVPLVAMAGAGLLTRSQLPIERRL